MTEGEASPRRSIHCVLWHAPDAPPAFELTALLVQRGLTLETCDNPYTAAARVCRHDRMLRAQRRVPEGDADAPSNNGAHPSLPGLVLLLAEPTRLPQRDAVAHVLELHAPRTLCWVYERALGPQLRAVTLASLAAGKDAAPGSTSTVPASVSIASHPSGGATTPPKSSLAADSPTERANGPVTGPASGPMSGLAGRPAASRPDLAPTQSTPGPPPRPRAPQVPINTANLLTDEELAMLLSDDDPAPRRPRTTS